MTSDELLKALRDAGFLTDEEVSTCVNELAAASSPAQDAQQAAARLVQSGKLTKFQSTQVLGGKAKALVMGDYAILDKIGAGGMGQVFKAQHRRMKRVVAIKLLPPSMLKNADAVKRFQREVEAAAKLMHSNIVTAFDAGQAGASHYLVMEYVGGHDLAAIVKQRGPLPVNEALNYIRQAAAGLAYAHSKGVVHRDIKPANLLVDDDGTVKILDMGLARFDDAGAAMQEGLTQSGQVMGTVDYMAPEQAFDTKHADARSDVYSLGCSFYRLLVGENMYGGDSMMQKFLAHREAPIPELTGKRNDVSPELQAVFARMVAKKPEQRYQTMNEVVSALDMCRSASGSTITSRDMSVTGEWRPSNNPGDSATELFGNQKLKRISELEPTFSGLASDSGTDPKSELRTAGPGRKPRGTSRGGKSPPWWTSRNVLIGAGGAGALALLLGVWLIIKNHQGEEVARVEAVPGVKLPVPAGGTVEVTNLPSPIKGEGVTAKDDPAFLTWMKTVADLTAYNQVEAVAKKLQEFNPGFDGKVTPNFKGRVVAELTFLTDEVFDISPVRALPGLTTLNCAGSGKGKGKLADLAPLADCKKLTTLKVKSTQVTPDTVASLQKVLTNCKIEWDGPAKSTTPPAASPPTVAASTAASPPSSPWPFDPKDGREYVWSEPENLGPTINGPEHDVVVSLTPDQRRLFYRTKEGRGEILAEASRTSSAEPFGKSKLSASGSGLSEPAVSGDGLTLVTGSQGFLIRTRPTLDAPWSKPVGLGPQVRLQAGGRHPALSSDGLTLLFNSDQNSPSRRDLWISRRKSQAESFGPATEVDPASKATVQNGLVLAEGQTVIFRQNGNLYFRSLSPTGITAAVPLLNQPFANDAQALFGLWLTPDGRTAYFSADRPGGFGGDDIWVTRRVPKAGFPSLVERLTSPDYVWTEPVNLGPKVNGEKPDYHPTVSADGLCLVFSSDRNGGGDLFECRRKSLDEPWGPPTVLTVLNTKSFEGQPALSADGLTLLFASTQGQGRARDSIEAQGGSDLYQTRRAARDAPWEKPVNLGPEINSAANDGYGRLSADGLTLYFDCDRPGQRQGLNDLWQARRTSLDAPWEKAVNLGPPINTKVRELSPQPLADGKSLLFLRGYDNTSRRLYLAEPATSGGYAARVVDSPVDGYSFWLTADGQTLLFDSKRPGGLGDSDLWMTRRVPRNSGTSASSVESQPAAGSGQMAAAIPAEALTFNGHRYLLVASPRTWEEAKQKAEAMGGHLVAINSQEERDSLAENVWLTRANETERDSCYLGGSLTDRKTWNWVTGEPVDMTLWSGRKGPDNNPSDLDVIVWIANGGWDDRPADKKAQATHFLVEWDTAKAESGKPSSRAQAEGPKAEGGTVSAPEFQKWMKDVQALPAEKQVEAVSKKLMELNPGFDGKVMGVDGNGPPKIEKGVVTEFGFLSDNVTDISPVRALVGLKIVFCEASGPGKRRKLSDLSPLNGMNLIDVRVGNTLVTDLSPLLGMKLTHLGCNDTKISDLSPLRGMPLTSLSCHDSPVADVSPLKGVPLKYLHCSSTQVSDLSPLRGMPLTKLECAATQVSDPSSLADCKNLRALYITKTKVTAAGIAALQKALPNCKIEWDGGKAESGKPKAEGAEKPAAGTPQPR